MKALSRRQALVGSLLCGLGAGCQASLSTSRSSSSSSSSRPVESYPPIPPLADEVYRQRRARMRTLGQKAEADLIFATAGAASFAYLVGGDFGRSERLIALVMPVSDGGGAAAEPFVLAPSFEVSRVEKKTRAGLKVVGWEEKADPLALLPKSAKRVLIEPHTEYGVVSAVTRAMPELQLIDGTTAFEELRAVKSDEEILRMRRAIQITEDAFAATFEQLEPGMREKDVADIAHDEQAKRGGSSGYALVQFGASAAYPHGGPTAAALSRDTVVLMDGGCTFQGWNSDVTRTRWFGDKPSAQFRAIYNIVHDAQTAAIARVKPGVAAQDIDRAARDVITRAGFGPHFTHRLGHGIGMEGHEPVYMVEGNARLLEPGLVFTVEPGIYLPGELGVRIEDEVLCTATGAEILTHRAPRL